MTPLVLGCVAGAALLHASWNAVLRGGRDTLWSTTLMMIAITVVSALAFLFVTLPDRASWPYVIGSAAIHIGYNLSLVRTYRSGDLGEAYPISRGCSPLLVTAGGVAFAHEQLDAASCVGIALVSGGILSLALAGGTLRADVLPGALLTGFLIGAYSVVDGIGVRHAGSSVAYTAAMFLLWSVTMPPLFVLLRGRPPRYTTVETVMALTGGLVSVLSYGIVIWAMKYGALGVVSALRETSVVYAAVIGRFFLHERLTGRRVASCLSIALGAACLAR